MTGEAWHQYLQTYVALRRAIGFSMQREAPLLQDFVAHLERRGQGANVPPRSSSRPTRSGAPGQGARQGAAGSRRISDGTMSLCAVLFC